MREFDDPELPDALVSDLRRLCGAPGSVPRETDVRVLGLPRSRRRHDRRRLVAAAAVFLLFGASMSAWLMWGRPGPVPVNEVAAETGGMDLDRDGLVNVADAMWLADAIARGESVGSWDIDEDGRITRHDPRALAQAMAAMVMATLPTDSVQQDATGEVGDFEVWDVYLDAAEAVRGYQVQIQLDGMTLSGIEGGAAPFGGAPMYDAGAMADGRVVLIAYADSASEPGRIHVARLHVLREQVESQFQSHIITVRSSDRESIPAELRLKKGDQS